MREALGVIQLWWCARLWVLSSCLSSQQLVGSSPHSSHFTPPSLSLITENSIPLRILYEKYGGCLTESNLIKVRGLLIEPAANSYVLAERDLYLENPEIKIRVRSRWGPRTALPFTHAPASLQPGAFLCLRVLVEGKHHKDKRVKDLKPLGRAAGDCGGGCVVWVWDLGIFKRPVYPPW